MATPRDHPSRTDTARTGTFSLGGDRTVTRLGFGAMRLPQDYGQACALLRRAVQLGVGLIDTAEFYGPGESERLIAQALQPYPDGLVIATKGLTHPPDRRFKSSQAHEMAPDQHRRWSSFLRARLAWIRFGMRSTGPTSLRSCATRLSSAFLRRLGFCRVVRWAVWRW